MSEENRPNLLYIHSDQHNPYVTGCYGDSLDDTPHLDALAARGVTLENTYCPSPICAFPHVIFPGHIRMRTRSGQFFYARFGYSHVCTRDGGRRVSAGFGGADARGRTRQLHGYADALW